MVENISDRPVKVEGHFTALDAQGKMLDLFEDSETIAPGDWALLVGSFSDLDSDKADYFRIELNESDADKAPFDSLTVAWTQVSGGGIFTVTNEGDEAFDWLNSYILFWKNGEVVKGIWQVFARTESPLAPGAAVSVLVDCEDDFDDVWFSFKD